ncbi:MAG: PAS domain S-box protein, partial [Deltaproteobacteria bacterium]|nr:PAS domain S-box protein [Deltaproteobacteria bacterium]
MAPGKHDQGLEEIRRLREALQEKEGELDEFRMRSLFLNALFNGINDEIMVLDQDFRVLEVNATFLENYGLKREEVLDRRCYEVKERISSPCSRGDRACPLERAMRTGERVEMTHRHGRDRGEPQEFVLTMYPLGSVTEGGDLFIEIARDVTGYRNLIRQLQASEKRFRTILDTATNAVISADEDHRILLFNNAAQTMFGYSRQEILGKDLEVLIPPRYGDHYSFVRRFVEKKEPEVMGRTISLTALRKGGEEFPIRLSLSHMEMDGKVIFTAIIRDVSEQRHLEKKLLQSERLAAVGQAVAHVAHELRNPLMIIGGFSSQLKNRLRDENDLRKLDMVLEEVARLERLVTNLGDFTKTYTLVMRMADVNAVLQDVIRFMTEIYPPGTYRFNEALGRDIG